jgi:hypothetical protein
LVLGCVAAALLTASPTLASEPLSDSNVRNLTLQVNTTGEALLSYTRQDGVVRHVLVWGAVDATAPDSEAPQAHFQYDYAGGWGKYHDGTYWQTFVNACKRYTGPALAYFVTGCDAPDGSYWTLQTWQRALPLLGFDPWLPSQTAWEIDISHWTGARGLASLDVYVHRTYQYAYQGLFGQASYDGMPIYGFNSTSNGVPRDRYGRNVYIDTYDSVYGPGWHRESGILLHRGRGVFCHSFVWQHPFAGYPTQQMRPPAPGTAYRVTMMGPGVTPTIEWTGSSAGDGWSPQLQAQATANFDRIMAGDARCARER